MWDTRRSAMGTYQYTIQVNRLSFLMNPRRYAATLLSVTLQHSGETLSAVPSVRKAYGAMPADAIDKVAADTDEALGEF